MAGIKWISVQSAGNPNGSDGVAPITLFNNPQFEVNNDTHGGLGGNDHYFSVVIENNYTVYKIIKNNVRSNQSIRGGYLAIAFSIPRGFMLSNSTPYLVLMDLWKTFRDHCMTLKDKVAGIYEYNSTSIDKTVLDEIAKSFTLRNSNKPYRPMNSKGAKALVVVPVDKIEGLLADVHYEEFSSFSEILIAETASQDANFEKINNLRIPRPASYTLWVDNQKRDIINDVDEVITIQSGSNPLYYINESKSFSIQDLLNGQHDYDISLDEANEKINVNTTNWAKPRKVSVSVRILPKDYEAHFHQVNNIIKLESPSGEIIKLDGNLSFNLVGKNISILPQIKVSIIPNSFVELVDYKIGRDEIFVTVKKKQQQQYVYQNINGAGSHRYATQENTTSLQPTNLSPVVDVLLLLDSSALFDEQSKIKMSLWTPSENDNKKDRIKSCFQLVSFKRFKGNSYEGHFYVPKLFKDSYIEFKSENCVYKSVFLDVNKDTLTLTKNDFSKVNWKKSKRNNTLLLFGAVVLFSLLMGIAIGYGIHKLVSSMSSSDKASVEKVINDNVVHENTDINYDEARAFLEKVGQRLMSKDVSFNEIQEFGNYLNEHSATLHQCDDEYSNGKVYNQIRDYSELSQFIINGDIESIKDVIRRYNSGNSTINPIHVDQIKLIVKNSDSQNQFMNNYSKILGFDKIGEVIKGSAGAPNNIATYQCDKCDKSFNTETDLIIHQSSSHDMSTFDCDKCSKSFPSQAELNNHKKSVHPSAKTRFSCPICGPNVYFNTKEGLDSHKRAKHER